MEKREITLYQTATCFYCRRVREQFKRLGIAYRTVEVPRNRAERQELFELSQQRGVPTLVDGEVMIRDDDDAIIAYLEKRYSSSENRLSAVESSTRS